MALDAADRDIEETRERFEQSLMRAYDQAGRHASGTVR
jgi:hypothetical protein